MDDPLDSPQVAILDIDLAEKRTGAREHSNNVLERPHPLDRLKLLEEVFKGELTLLHLGGGPLGAGLVEGFLGLLDQGQHVTHPENARSHSLGVKGLETLQGLPHPDELDRDSGHRTGRDGGPTPGVAVEFGEDEPGQVEPVLKALGNIDSFLTGHRIHHEKGLVWRCLPSYISEFVHQLLVDLQPAGGVDDHHVPVQTGGLFESCSDQSWRPGRSFGEDGNPDPLTQGLQLLNGSRALEISRH